MGKDITGVPVVTDLARAPHMLVAGTTGSGKSVAINAIDPVAAVQGDAGRSPADHD